MTLGDLLCRADELDSSRMSESVIQSPGASQIVHAVTHDSRNVQPGTLFVGLQGEHADGATYAKDAERRGAIAVVSGSPQKTEVSLPWITVSDAREALAALSASFYDLPSHELMVLGITGTNGKTTTTHLLSEIFEQAGMPCGRLGTVSHQIGNETREAALTTPEAPEIQGLLRELVDGGSMVCAMEVSSHGLALRRVDFTRFTAAVFTNLSRDHLDFHGDMDSYFLAKRRLFDDLPSDARTIVNLDDPRGSLLASAASRPVTYAIDQPADVVSDAIDSSFNGLVFNVRTSRGSLHLRSNLLGRINVYNILAAVATAIALDLPFDAIEQGVESLKSVPGRMQVVSHGDDDLTVIVDFAHTDDALKQVLEGTRALTSDRVVVVFGCGGDRDRSKRPLMGAVAARLGDVVIVTSDNPRSEDPLAIMEDITHGMDSATQRSKAEDGEGTADFFRTPYLTISDRKLAIERAIREAHAGDVVVIAGKGHETYQEIGSERRSFDDLEIAQDALRRRRTNALVS
jgi:UDP-N-acetylmuramoyl-L-alanyl-D-glutamate--2,6-diaminopimelate ligase|tara:strand:+ start:4721 stop:6271 length:1551 start_codon:yes stop_codon:yes gene_type:complete